MPPVHSWLLKNDVISETTGNGNYTTIPKIIYKVYIDKTGGFPSVDNMKSTGRMVIAHRSWREMNPGYEVRYFNLDSCRQYLAYHFHPVFLRAFDCIEAFAGKVNLFRMCVVYVEGGWYSDWKQECLEENLLENLSKGAEFFGLWDWGQPRQQKCVQNYFFGATPQHFIVRETLEKILLHVQA